MAPKEHLRDEAAHEMAELQLSVKRPEPLYFPFLELLEDTWQEVHAEEEDYENLAQDYTSGMADMVIRIGQVWLDELRERAVQHGAGGQAEAIHRFKQRIADAQSLLEEEVKRLYV